MKVISVINQKGGVGKSTTAGAIATGIFKYSGRKTLAIDLDSQGNLTYVYGATGAENSSLDLLTGEPAERCITRTASGDIIPADNGLALVMPGTPTKNSKFTYIAEDTLKKAIQPLKSKYDYIIIDTPPTLSALTINGLTASTDVVIPALADVFSLQGIAELFKTIDQARKSGNPTLNVAGILLTQYSQRSVLGRDAAELITELATLNGTKVFETTIRQAVAVREAQISQKPLFDYAPTSKVTKDYLDFITELIKETEHYE